MDRSRYEIILRMTWNVVSNPETDYVGRIFHVGGDSIPFEFREEKEVQKVQVTNLGQKRFRRMIKKK